jgi:hypothetical protein
MARLVLILTILAALVAAAPAAATYPGRNGPIAYLNDAGWDEPPAGYVTSGIVIRRVHATDPHDVLIRCSETPGGGDCGAVTPSDLSFSPKGRLIVFDAGARIGLIAPSGGPVILLPAATTNDGDPVFTPDGKRIVFTGANDHGGTDLYVRSVNGKGAARLLIEDAAEPAVSVRGVLAYVRNDTVYARKHGKQRRVLAGWSPDWSPDGRRLVIVRPGVGHVFSNASGFGRLYAVRPNGQGLKRLGPEVVATNPIWSPDGRWISYDLPEAGVSIRRVGDHGDVDVWAPSECGDNGDPCTQSYGPAWRPVPR